MEMTCNGTGRLSPIAITFHRDESVEPSNTVLDRVPKAALYRTRISRIKPVEMIIFAITLMRIFTTYRFRDSAWVRIISIIFVNDLA